MNESTGAPLDFNGEPIEWIATLSVPFAVQLKVEAQSSLFTQGDPALNCYFVQFGQLMVYRPLTPAQPTKPKAAIRMFEDGDLISFGNDGRFAANCIAIVDSSVLCIDRHWLEQQAELDPVLRRILTTVNASENEWLNLNSAASRTADLAD